MFLYSNVHSSSFLSLISLIIPLPHANSIHSNVLYLVSITMLKWHLLSSNTFSWLKTLNSLQVPRTKTVHATPFSLSLITFFKYHVLETFLDLHCDLHPFKYQTFSSSLPSDYYLSLRHFPSIFFPRLIFSSNPLLISSITEYSPQSLHSH